MTGVGRSVTIRPVVPLSEQGDLSSWAYQVAETHLGEDVPRRWRHTQSCIEMARGLEPAVPGDADHLIAAVTLHDIGFCDEAQKCGFSTLDGAWFLQRLGAPERLVGLVAHQMGAVVEAELRGFLDHWQDFPQDEHSPTRDALWACCLKIGPDGQEMTAAERRAEMLVRYDNELIHIIGERVWPEAEAAERRTRERLEAAAK